MNYNTITTEGYMGHPGYQGENFRSWNWSEKELKRLLLQEYKKNGIKASIKRNRGGWTTSLTITITADKTDFVDYADLYEWEKKYGVQVNHYRAYDDRFTFKFNQKLNLIYMITRSFNYDNSNCMVDYHDTGFYVGFYVKCKE